jgi:hypothetical protein
MKRSMIVSFFVLNMNVAFCQQATATPYFFSSIVKDVSASSIWYQRLLNIKVKHSESNAQYGYKLAILESPTVLIELMELKGSVSPAEVVKDATAKMQGHFKIGFKVSNMDDWLTHIKKIGLESGQVWKDAETGKRNFMVTDPDGNIIQFFD